MKRFKIRIPIKLRAKPRPRFNGRFAYTDPTYKKHETELKWLMKCAFKDEPFSKSVELHVEVHYKTKDALLQMNLARPDVDNLAKSILDAANDIIYTDDKIVWRLEISKYKSHEDCVWVSGLGE